MADVRSTTGTPTVDDFGVGTATSNVGTPVVVDRSTAFAYALDSANRVAQIAGRLTLLFIKRLADMQLTTDQSFTKSFTGTRYEITSVVAHCKTGGATVACAGGIYTAAAKGGTPLVAAAQSWIGLSAANKLVTATLAAVVGTDSQTATPILSLTTGSTAPVTADIFIWGYILD